jgi:hypothetical protein
MRITYIPGACKVQQDLPSIETERHARETRRAAMEQSRAPNLLRILELFRNAGPAGLTRDEVAIRLDLAPTTPCHPVNVLLKDGELVETSRRRVTRNASYAAVVVHRMYREIAEDLETPFTIAGNAQTTSDKIIHRKRFDREAAWNATFMRLRVSRRNEKGVALDDDDLEDIESETKEIVSNMESTWRASCEVA